MLKNLLRVTLLLALVLTAAAFVMPDTAHAQPAECWEEFKVREQGFFFGVPTEIVTFETRFNRDCLTIDDGRENNLDLAASAAIYCVDGGVTVLDIDLMGRGEPIITVGPQQLSEVPRFPAENTVIAEAGGFGLYRLTSGELQVNAPPIYSTDPYYVFIWDGCAGVE